MVEERDDRLLVSQGRDPLELADRPIFDAVFRHDEKQACAGADRLVDLRVPILARLDVSPVEPGRYVGRSRLQGVVELEGEVPGVDPGITDEVVTGHRPPFLGIGTDPRGPLGDPARTMLCPRPADRNATTISPLAFEYIETIGGFQWRERDQAVRQGRLLISGNTERPAIGRHIVAALDSAHPRIRQRSLRGAELSTMGIGGFQVFGTIDLREVCPSSAMSMPMRPRTLTGSRSLARAAGAAVILIGGLVLVGWLFDIETLKSIIPGMIAMNPGGTAVAFLLAGVSLWIQSAPASRRLRAVAMACAGGVVLWALLRLGGYLLAWDGGPDQLLFREKLALEDRRAGYPNRMAPEHGGGPPPGRPGPAAPGRAVSARRPGRPVRGPGDRDHRAAGHHRLRL